MNNLNELGLVEMRQSDLCNIDGGQNGRPGGHPVGMTVEDMIDFFRGVADGLIG